MAAGYLMVRRYNESKAFNKKYEELLSGARPDTKMTRVYGVLFLVRRLLFAGSAVFLTGWPFLQVNLLFLQSLVMILYIIHWRPLESGNGIEIFNELCIIAVTYPSLIFSGFSNSVTSH